MTRISWPKAADEVAKVTGKRYSPHYIREVATGYRTNNQLVPVLKDLGIYQVEAA
ncbi:MAG: hypothetical protein MJY78_02625 [Fibrobacter sp.]|nr:hypothetical protein [Fibrobacter sp.]